MKAGIFLLQTGEPERLISGVLLALSTVGIKDMMIIPLSKATQVEASSVGQVSMATIGLRVHTLRAMDATSTSARATCTPGTPFNAPTGSLCARSQNKDSIDLIHLTI